MKAPNHLSSQWVISRRKFIWQSSLTTLAMTSGFSLTTTKNNLRFGLTADSHYAKRPQRGTRFYNESHLKMREFVQIMNQKKVDFIMHLGDMKDQDENEKEQDTLNYLNIIESEFSNFNGPKYHCVGNHDVDSITKSQFLNGIENTNIPKTNSYYSFDFNPFHCIVLDA
ncbi:MAG: metallophosphoesterase, partial [Flavobacteriaceae bacterium]|nr:metallophosphoesterase [Flavobacteriaceae bacterium]